MTIKICNSDVKLRLDIRMTIYGHVFICSHELNIHFKAAFLELVVNTGLTSPVTLKKLGGNCIF